MSTSNRHGQKEVLSTDDIIQIVSRRNEKGAVTTLAKEFNISAPRVRKVWEEYYGGTTLKEAATGLKKPLPTSYKALPPEQQADLRRSGGFVVDPPRMIDAGGGSTRANPVRKVDGKLPRSVDPLPAERLPPPPPPDERLEIEQGIMNAGNDSVELRESIVGRLKTLTRHNEPNARQSVEDYIESAEEASEYEPSVQSGLDLGRDKKSRYHIQDDVRSTQAQGNQDNEGHGHALPEPDWRSSGDYGNSEYDPSQFEFESASDYTRPRSSQGSVLSSGYRDPSSSRIQDSRVAQRSRRGEAEDEGEGSSGPVRTVYAPSRGRVLRDGHGRDDPTNKAGCDDIERYADECISKRLEAITQRIRDETQPRKHGDVDKSGTGEGKGKPEKRRLRFDGRNVRMAAD